MLTSSLDRQRDSIDATKAKLADLKSQYGGVDAPGFDELTDSLKEQQDALADTKSRLMDARYEFIESSTSAAEMSEKLEETSKSASKLKNALTFRNALSGIGSALKSLSGIGIVEKIAGHFTRATSSGQSFGAMAKAVAGKVFSLGNIIKTKLLSLAVNAVMKNFGSALKSLAGHSASVNNALSKLQQGARGLSGSLASAFAPILTSVQPILSKLIDIVTNAINAVSQFFAKLSGASSWKKAVPALQSYADGASKAAGATKDATNAAEEYKRAVMGFDQLNKLDDQGGGGSSPSGSDGGGSGSSGSGGDGITWVDMPIDNEIASFVDKFKEAWENADFTEIGRIVGEKLRDALNSIPWDTVKEQCNKVAKSVATFLNGFFETPGLFEAVGTTIGEAINTAIGAANTFLETFHFESLGNAITTALYTAFETIDFGEIGSLLSNLRIAVYDTLTGAIEGIDWYQLPSLVATKVKEFFEGFDFSGVSASIGRLLGAALSAAIDLVDGIGDLIGDGFFAIGDYFQGKIEECGGNIWKGILKGIKDAAKAVGSWIKTNLWTPFVNAFKKAFGINTESGTYQLGKKVSDAIYKGVKAGAKAIINFFKNPIGTLKIALSSGWKAAVNTWKAIKNSTVVKTLKQQGKALIDKVKTSWDAIKSKTAKLTAKVVSTISAGLTAIVNWGKTGAKTLKTKIIGTVSDAIKSIAAWGKEGAKTLKAKIVGTIDNVIKAIVNWGKNAKELKAKILGTIDEKIKSIINWGVSGAKTLKASIVGTIGNSIKSIINWGINGAKELKANITGTIDNIIKAIVNWGKNAKSLTVNILKGSINTVIQTLLGWIGKAKEFKATILKGSINSKVDTLIDWVGKTKNLTVNIIDTISEALKSLIEFLKKGVIDLTVRLFGPDDTPINQLAIVDESGTVSYAEQPSGPYKVTEYDFSGVPVELANPEGEYKVTAINPGSGFKPVMQNGGLQVTWLQDKIAAASKIIGSFTAQFSKKGFASTFSKIIGGFTAQFSKKDYSSGFSRIIGGLTALFTKKDYGSGTGGSTKFRTFSAIAEFITKKYGSSTGGSTKFRTFSSIAEFISKTYGTGTGGSAAFRTFDSKANFLSRIIGFSTTVSGMTAGLGSKSVTFGKTVTGMTAEIAHRQFASTFSFTIGGFTISIGRVAADGGVYANGWKPVQSFASGGSVSMGQLFVAREAGPELVGTLGTHTAVMNNDQIVSSVAAGVRSAVVDALMSAGSRSGDVVIYIDSTELARATMKGTKLLDKQMNPHVVFG